jgi:hypothetical protein
MIIYLDMDDVVADWRTAAEEFLQLKFPNGDQWSRIPDDKWAELKRNSRFYRDLPIKDSAHDLVNYCRDAVAAGLADDLRFLTALPHNDDMPYASYDKVLWAIERFERIPVLFGPYSKDKWRHCQPGDILIDDRTSNCMEWENAGGHAHIYRTWEGCKPWLTQILASKVAV